MSLLPLCWRHQPNRDALKLTDPPFLGNWRAVCALHVIDIERFAKDWKDSVTRTYAKDLLRWSILSVVTVITPSLQLFLDAAALRA
jgi:hypothetical protein